MPIPDLSPTFERLDAPGAGRAAWQLTTGDAFCYPLYYFVPSTFDRYLVHHRADATGVQLWRLDLGTGESVQLTHATGDDTHWRPWCVPAGPSVLDHRSAIDPVRGEVIYFDGAQARAVDIRARSTTSIRSAPAASCSPAWRRSAASSSPICGAAATAICAPRTMRA
ncbi:hypothetical protein [Jiangella anatolica]|uniref:Uncharacterized protein n=1 Tax=Jiangella anatolica TaxID=2670374 RepID=A0A2W2CZD2_9ACTN|nr:hypothetical protein [Jiangella anatolica]PZF85603.1 hypothetical protein C1I92_04350 [Jiangella anatolica]